MSLVSVSSWVPFRALPSFYNHVPNGFIKRITPHPILIFSLSRLSGPRARVKQVVGVTKSLETNPLWISGSGVFQDKTPPLTPFHQESLHPRACLLAFSFKDGDAETPGHERAELQEAVKSIHESVHGPSVTFHGKMEKEHFTRKSQPKLSTWSAPLFSREKKSLGPSESVCFLIRIASKFYREVVTSEPSDPENSLLS